MGVIYCATIAIWALILTAFSFSKGAQYVSNRVFNILLVLALIPVFNTIMLLSTLYTALIDKRTKEEKLEALKEQSEYLDILLEDFINKIKNNG